MITYILIFNHDLRTIEIFVKLLYSFSIIVFNMMKFLVILFMIKLFTQINIFIASPHLRELFFDYQSVLCQHKFFRKTIFWTIFSPFLKIVTCPLNLLDPLLDIYNKYAKIKTTSFSNPFFAKSQNPSEPFFIYFIGDCFSFIVYEQTSTHWFSIVHLKCILWVCRMSINSNSSTTIKTFVSFLTFEFFTLHIIFVFFLCGSRVSCITNLCFFLKLVVLSRFTFILLHYPC